MANRWIANGSIDQSAAGWTDGDVIRSVIGEQGPLTGLNKSTKTFHRFEMGEKSRIYNSFSDPLICDLNLNALTGANQVEDIGFNVAATGGNLTLRIQKPDGTFATTANSAWSATDATLLSNLNTQLDAATGVAGGIVATAIPYTDTDLGVRLTYSGAGYAGLPFTAARVVTFFTTSTSATYTPAIPSTLVDSRPDSRPWYFTPGGPAALIQRVQLLGAGTLYPMTSGRINRWEQASGKGVIPQNVRIDDAWIVGGTYNQAIYDPTNLATNPNVNLRLQACNFTSERGFSGECKVGNGANALFQLANMTGALAMPTGGTLRVDGGRCTWMLGSLTTLHLFDGEFDLSQVPKDMAVTTLHTTGRMLRSLKTQLKSANANVTLPSTVGVDLFIYADKGDSLIV